MILFLLLSLPQKARLSVCFVILKIPLFGLLWFFILENTKLNCKSNKSDIASENTVLYRIGKSLPIHITTISQSRNYNKYFK